MNEFRSRFDDDRYLHEPRALWTVQQIESPASASEQSLGRVTVDKDHFRNVSRYPMTLTHLSVAAINYTLREQTFSFPFTVKSIYNSMVIQNLVKVFFSAPYSLHIPRRDLIAGAFPPMPTSEPGMMYSTADFASGVWGVSRWTFERPLFLPPKSNIQFDLAAPSLPTGSVIDAVRATTSMHFEEIHSGMLGGDSRLRTRSEMPWVERDHSLFGADGFGMEAGGLANPWNVAGIFTPRQFKAQESDRGQDINAFSGFAVAIDQIDYDDGTNGNGTIIGPIAPLSTRIGTRARTRAGGTGEWWWRPGCPLCLVTPTITPALVYKLPVPIELAPGEEIEMEVEVPAAPVSGYNNLGAAGDGQVFDRDGLFIFIPVDPIVTQPRLQIGVSLTGYASIERGVAERAT